MTNALQAVAEGKIKRLMINMPPRHGKTELVSRRFPAYMLGLDPTAKVIGCSYSADLAQSVNRDVQRIMLDKRYRQLFPASRLNETNVVTRADGSWLRNSTVFEIIGIGGSYRGTGIGGPITGQGMTLGIIDDPFKNAEEADSPTTREKVWNWWTSTFLTRDEGDAAIICTFTRWHEDDLAGRILAQAKETGEEWTVIDLPAVRDTDEDEQDPRAIGEALWPGKYDLAKLEKRRKSLGPRWWEALFQQRPSAATGNIFRRSYWKTYQPDELPKFDLKLQSWDTAHGEGQENDFSVCVTAGVYQGDIYVLDVWADRVEFPTLKAQARALHARDLPSWLLIERKASGQDLIPELMRKNKGQNTLPIWGKVEKPGKPPKPGVIPAGDKIARAHGVVSMVSDGMVYVPEAAPWLADFLNELAGFPFAKHDDRVDAFTQLLNWVRTEYTQPRQKLISNKPGAFRRRPY